MTASAEFDAAIAEIESQSVKFRSLIEEARLARVRSWPGERAHIHAALAKAQMIARKMVELAIDAQVEVEIARTES